MARPQTKDDLIKTATDWIKRNFIMILATILIIIGVSIVVITALSDSFNDGSNVIDPELADQYGGFISGVVGSIFTLTGFLFLYQTMKIQRDQFNLQQFESRLFELIRYHRENVQTIKFTTPYKKEETIIEGREAIIVLKKQCIELNNSLENILAEKFSSENIIRISYTLFFFGVGKTTMEMSKEQLRKLKHKGNRLLDEKDINVIVNFVRARKAEYNDMTVFYGGHQSKLGSYFRHIYRTLKYVDEHPSLSNANRTDYAKLFRSQLTTYEQALIFFNSRSPMGKKWRELMVKYEMIKNIPPAFIEGVDHTEYYPEIEFEFYTDTDYDD